MSNRSSSIEVGNALSRWGRVGFASLAMGLLLGVMFGGLVAAVASPHRGLVTDIVRVDDQVYSVSPVGLVAGWADDAVVLVNPPTRFVEVAAIRIGESPVLVLVGGEPGVSGVVGLYDLASESYREQVVADDLIYSVADVGADGLVVGGADGRVLVSRTGAGLDLRFSVRYAHTAPVRSVASSPDGLRIASGGLDGLVMVSEWGSQDEPLVLQDHSDKVESVIFSPDSRMVYSGARDGRVRVHSVAGRLLRTYANLGGETVPWGRQSQVLTLAISRHRGLILAGTSSGVLLRLSPTGTAHAELGRFGGAINALAVDDRLWLGVRSVRSINLAEIEAVPVGP